jgi:tetratricopeptide (TPR) repeat protein
MAASPEETPHPHANANSCTRRSGRGILWLLTADRDPSLMESGRVRALGWLGLALLLGLAWLCYRPGLSGGFLFDDLVNLNALGATGTVDDWPTFWRYVTSGSADPTGRPLALLSFLLDARDWPADPAPFLRTNLILHLLDGLLLFALLRKLAACLGDAGPRLELQALLGAGAWLLHPLLVSTTLYAVQREAMLPATFTLLGLLAYATGRMRYAHSAGRQGLALMVAGLVGGTVLAVASKANGALLPLLALALEATVFARLPRVEADASRRLRRWQAIVLVAPTALVLAYLASWLPALTQPPGVRSFTLGQRLLTEPRVLLDYLQLLAIPRSASTGLFNDSYVVSRDLLHPWTTLPALALVLALAWGAWRLRARAPAASAALLFFFAGHLLESTIVPLELYFEHRNYLPTLLLGWPLARGLLAWQRPGWLRGAVAIGVIALLAATTWQRASLWGQPDKLAALWALQGSSSSRAQAAAAIEDARAGRFERAGERLEPLWRSNPNDLQIGFNYIAVRCALGGLGGAEKRQLAAALRHTPNSALMTHEWLASAVQTARNGECPGMTLDDVEGWVQSLAANPAFGTPRARVEDVEPLLAMLAIARRQPDAALAHFNAALRVRPSPDTAARQAVTLATDGYYAQALAHLDAWEAMRASAPPPGRGMAWLHAKVLEWQGYWPKEMAILRAHLREELRRQDAHE